MKNAKAQTAKDWIQMSSSLSDILKFTKSVIDELHGEYPEAEFKRVLFEFIVRFHLNFTVIANSWKDFLNNSKFKFPFYILLRSLISDLIIMLYLMDGLKIDRRKQRIIDDEFKMRFIEISNSHFIKIEREIKKLVQERKVTSTQADKFLKQQKQFYPEHFEPGSHVKVKSMPDLMPGALTKKLKGTKWRKFAGIYQHYTYFSQYEHFTSKTIDIMLNDRNKEFKTFTVAVDFLLIGLLANVATIGLAPKFIDDLDRISNEFKLKFDNRK